MNQLPESIEDISFLPCPHCGITYSQDGLLKQVNEWMESMNKHREAISSLKQGCFANADYIFKPKTYCAMCDKPYIIAYAPAEKRFVDIHTEEYCHGTVA